MPAPKPRRSPSASRRSTPPPSPSPPRPVLFAAEPVAPDAPRIRVVRMADEERPAPTHWVTFPHSHQFFELVFLERAAGRHRLGGEEWTTEAGDLLLIAPGEVHVWDPAILALDTAAWVVHFEPDALAPIPAGSAGPSLLAHLANPLLFPFLRSTRGERGRLTVPAAERPAWVARFRQLKEELAAQRVGYQEAARALLALTLVDATRLIASADRHAVRAQPTLAGVFRFIEAHYARPISLADVAKAVHRTPAYLTSLVRRSTGRAVLEWIVERRMLEARRLLVETDLAVERIGEAVSYADPTYFIRQFRKAHGTTPAAWRRANR